MGSTQAVPKYRLHKGSGQAFIQVKGRRIYLGRHGTKKSRERYGEELAKLDDAEPAYKPAAKSDASYTVVELAAAYLDHAEAYYRKGGVETETVGEVGRSLKALAEKYGKVPVADFGPLKLKHLQRSMVKAGLARTTINDRIGIVKRAFRWGVSEELVPAHVDHALRAVEGLRKGRTDAKEKVPVQPVPDEVVDRTIEFLTPVVADMVRFQRLTGCRPAEVCMIRPMDVDRSGEVWRYVPESHKTEHHGKARTIFIGPKAQDVLRAYLLRPEDAHCFSPAESEQKRMEQLHAARRTPLGQGNRPGSNRKRWPKRKAGDHYDTASYRRAIHRAVDRLNKQLEREAEKAGHEPPEPLERWSPNQLRHTAGTRVRHKYGLEGAQVLLGHSRADVTQVYAERDMKLGERIAAECG